LSPPQLLLPEVKDEQ
jgi:hypothetical protein